MTLENCTTTQPPRACRSEAGSAFRRAARAAIPRAALQQALADEQSRLAAVRLDHATSAKNSSAGRSIPSRRALSMSGP